MPVLRFVRSVSCLVLPAALAMVLSGCGAKNEETGLANLDAQLTGNSADPVLRAAVEDRITVDPDLVAQSNRNSIRPADKPLNGTVPAATGRAPADGAVEKLAGGPLMQAPAALSDDSKRRPDEAITLGGLARLQKAGGKGRACPPPPPALQYSNSWAQRLPAAFPLYPDAQLREAAGAGSGICGMRAVSFTTAAPVQDVLNFYYTLARRAGYSAERQARDGQDILGGTRNEAAYYLALEPAPGGGTRVNLIVNGGI